MSFKRPNVRTRRVEFVSTGTPLILKSVKPIEKKTDQVLGYQWNPIENYKYYAKHAMRTERERLALVLKSTNDVVDRIVIGHRMSLFSIRQKQILIEAFSAWRQSDPNDIICERMDKYYLKDSRERIAIARKKEMVERKLVHKHAKRVIETIIKNKMFNLKVSILKEWLRIAVTEKKIAPDPLPTFGGENPLNYVIAKTSVMKKSKKVKVALSVPMLNLYTKYYSNGLNAPISEKIQAYAKLGYPMWFLEKMLKSREANLAKKPKIEAMIATVFDKYMKSKPTKVKEKTLHQKVMTSRGKLFL